MFSFLKSPFQRIETLSKISNTPSKQKDILIDLFNQAKEDKEPNSRAHKLSIALLISAELGNKKIYDSIYAEMKTVLEQITDHSYKSLILTRALSAANTINDLEDYLENKTEAKQAADTLAAKYKTGPAKKSEILAQEKLTSQNTLSDAVWGYVFLARAAANAGDIKTVTYAREQMKKLTGTRHTIDAIKKGLPQSSSSTHFPTWAIATMLLADAKTCNPLTIDRTKVHRFEKFKIGYQALQKETQKHITESSSSDDFTKHKKLFDLKADSLLAELILQKAEELKLDKQNAPEVQEILKLRERARAYTIRR